VSEPRYLDTPTLLRRAADTVRTRAFPGDTYLAHALSLAADDFQNLVRTWGAPLDALIRAANDIARQDRIEPETRARLMYTGERIQDAIELAKDSPHTDGAHHKQWIIDQMLRLIAGPLYEQIAADVNWDEGIAP
jgi:hypothetical protein